KKTPSLSELPSQLRIAYLIFLLSLVFINFGRNSIRLITSLFLADSTGFSALGVDIALYSNIASIAAMVSGLALGTVVAKSDDNKVMVSGAILSLAGIGWLIFTPTFTLALLASFLIGASQIVIQSASYSIVAKMAPEEYRGRLFAYYNTTFFLSFGVAATLIAGPLSNADAYRGSFIAALGIITIGIVILLISFRYTRRLEPQLAPVDELPFELS
ncbi:MAG: MFS transporter, partial [Candidatus Thorarchaeota archaeon]